MKYWSIHEAEQGGFRYNITKGDVKGYTFNLNIPFSDLGSRDFRLFIPPGAATATMSWFCPNDALVGTNSKIGNPIKYTPTEWDLIPWERDNGGNFDRLKQDYCAKNAGGHGTILYQNAKTVEEIVKNGFWINTCLIEKTGFIKSVQPTITVMADMFFNWYNSVKDNNNMWDSMGNPIVDNIEQPANPPVNYPSFPGIPTNPQPPIEIPPINLPSPEQPKKCNCCVCKNSKIIIDILKSWE